MSRITNKHIIKIKELISDEVCMGTFGLVELELLEMEKDFSEQLQNTASNSDYAKLCKAVDEGHLSIILESGDASLDGGVDDALDHADNFA